MSRVSGAVVREQTDAIRAALVNEALTRKRVDALEVRADGKDDEVQAVQRLLMRGLWGRLKWLLSGK